MDPCVDAVDRFLKWETDGAKRSMALEGALTMPLGVSLESTGSRMMTFEFDFRNGRRYW